MKNIFSILFFYLFLVQLTYSQTTFDLMFKTKAIEGYGYPVEKDDGYYYFLGGINDSVSNDRIFDVVLMKVSSDGNNFLQKQDFSEDTVVGLSYNFLYGDHFLGLGGYKFNYDTIKGGLYNILYNTDLDIYKKSIFPFPGKYTIIRSSSESLLRIGDKLIKVFSISEPYDNLGFEPGDIAFYVFNLMGDTIRTKIHKMDKVQHAYDVCFNSDSTQVWLFGYGFQDGSTQWVKFDMNFNIISIKEFDYRINRPFNIIQENKNKWIGCTRYVPHNTRQNDQLLVFRMDSLGNFLNEISLGAPDTIDYPSIRRSIGFSENGEIYIAGTKNSTIGLFPDIQSWVMFTKLNNDFEIEFNKYYNNDGKYYESNDLMVTSDGGIILSNVRYDSKDNEEPPYDLDCWIIKVDENGYMTDVEENESIITKNALAFPNPGTNELKISCGWPNSVIRMYNLQGMEVINKQLQSVETSINTSFLDSGKYIWNIYSNNKIIESGKWIKL